MRSPPAVHWASPSGERRAGRTTERGPGPLVEAHDVLVLALWPHSTALRSRRTWQPAQLLAGARTPSGTRSRRCARCSRAHLRKDSCARTPLFDFREWEPPAKIEAPAPEHVNAVIAAADAAARGPIILAATAGLRRGEVFALRWV